MDTRQVAAEYRLAYWAKIINDHKASGISVKALCETTGINEGSYYYWQKKLRETACQELNLPPALQTMELSKNEKRSVPNGWVVCGAEQKTELESLRIEIGQYRVIVPEHVNTDLLARVCKVLVAI